jgi:hypothetical protein
MLISFKDGSHREIENLKGENLFGAILSGTDFSNKILTDTIFVNCELSNCNFYGAILSNVDLSHSNLKNTNFSHAKLDSAKIYRVSAECCDFSYANLSYADLSFSNLSYANLMSANLYNSKLISTNMKCANLNSANLRDANLYNSNLNRALLINSITSGIKHNENTVFFALQCPEEGSFIGWKKCRNDIIVKLLITEDSKRSSATTRKCRASKVKVLEILINDNTQLKLPPICAVSLHDISFLYKVGETIEVDNFDDDRWDECSNGIHFFLTKQEAINY